LTTIVNLEKNNIFVTNELKSPCLKASLNFERVVDQSNLSEVGILPIFFIYVMGLEDTEESKNLYKEYYKELLLTMSALFPHVYYINYFEGEVIYTLQESVIQTNEQLPTKIPTKTELSIYKN
jgi:hypothetical protein